MMENLYLTEMVGRRKLGAIELTVKYIDCINSRRILEAIHQLDKIFALN